MEEKRKRGRPRTRFVDENQPKRARGRPRKPVDPNAIKEKRPRGRPRKEIDETQIKPKRPRGRPRKYDNGFATTEWTLLGQNDNVSNKKPYYNNAEQNYEEPEYIVPTVEKEYFDEAKESPDKELVDFMNFDAEELEMPTPSRNALQEKVEEIREENEEEDEIYQPQVSLNPPKQETRPNVSRSRLPVKEEKKSEKKPVFKTMFSGVNKVVVITGATSGMGFAMAKNLALLGQTVIAIGRRPSLCRDARNEILAEDKNANIHFLVADLSLMSQVKILADEIKAKLVSIGRDNIDVLIHNAGICTNNHKITYENNEIMWATNYLSAFLLTKLLQPYLDRSKDARVITIGDSKLYDVELNWKDIKGRTEKSNEKVYAQTKLADLMFAMEYDHRYSDRDDLHAYCVNPGSVNTQFYTKNVSGIRRWFLSRWEKKGKTIEQGIETTMYLTLAEKLPKNVVFYENKKPAEPCKFAVDPRNRSALWRYSEIALTQELD